MTKTRFTYLLDNTTKDPNEIFTLDAVSDAISWVWFDGGYYRPAYIELSVDEPLTPGAGTSQEGDAADKGWLNLSLGKVVKLLPTPDIKGVINREIKSFSRSVSSWLVDHNNDIFDRDQDNPDRLYNLCTGILIVVRRIWLNIGNTKPGDNGDRFFDHERDFPQMCKALGVQSKFFYSLPIAKVSDDLLGYGHDDEVRDILS